MSFPVRYCFLAKSASHPEALAKMAPVMKRNLEGGHFSVLPCDCEPPCRAMTQGEVRELFARFRAWGVDEEEIEQ